MMEYLKQLYNRFFGYSAVSGCSHSAPKIVCFGNVLLDYTAQLTDTELLERFQLTLEEKGELDAETLSTIISEVCEQLECRTNPGGSALNTARILRLLGSEALFFGAVGEDKHALKLREIFEDYGVNCRLEIVTSATTGQCVCLVHKDNTALYANIGASSEFSIDFLQRSERDTLQTPFLRPIERKQILYIEGFFLPQREEVVEYIVKTYIHERRRLAINLSANYIVDQNYEKLLFLARNAFLIFGNRNEFQTLCNRMDCCNSVDDIAKELTAGGAVKIIIITKGGDGVDLISNYVDDYSPPGELSFHSFNAPRVEDVIDTTGAGDGFVAGFLHAFLEKRSLSECIRIACDVAAKVVTQIGCNLPSTDVSDQNQCS